MLDLTVVHARTSRVIASFRAEADPADPAELNACLADALARGGWPERRTGEFELRIRETLTQRDHLPFVMRAEDR